jgi:hypothetical protein
LLTVPAPGPVAPIASLDRDGAPAPVSEGRPAVAAVSRTESRTESPKGSEPKPMLAAPPRDLLERPDLFIDYSVIQKLDVLESSERAG